MNFTEAKEYGRLITKQGSHVSVTRVRLYDGHRYNWHQLLRSGNTLYAPTDQTHDLQANSHGDITRYDEVWFDGVCVYKKPFWRKIMFWRTK